MKFIVEEHQAEYCKFYDYAMMTGANPRVGIPLHSIAARRIMDVVETEPEFYDELIRVYPHVDAQRRIWADFDVEGLIALYADDGWDGIRDLIDDNMLTGGHHQLAMQYAAKYRKKHALDPYSFPVDNLARSLLLKEFRGTVPTPVGPKTKAHAMRQATIVEPEI